MIEDWVKCRFEDLLDYEQPTNYIVNSTEYDDSYETPVLTAGKSFIKGYTNEKDGIFDNLPTIIFDDFTTASQFVNFKFKVKSSAMKILVPTSDLINMKFVYYAMLVNKVRSDTHKRYWISIYSKKEIFIPSVNEQRAIVSKIEELFSDLDKGVTDLKKAQDQLKVYRQAVLKKAFEGELTKEWRERKTNLSNWKFDVLKNIATLNPKPQKDKIPNDLELQFLPMRLVEEIKNVIHLDETRKFEELQKKSYTFFEEGDVLFAKVTPCMENGKIAIAKNLKNKMGYGSSEFHVFRVGEKLLNEYLFHFLVQEKFRVNSKHAMTGAVGLKRVPKKFLEDYKIPLPSLDEQHQIVQEIESRLSVCDKVEENITESLEKAEALRQSILKKAFEGRLLSTQEIEKCKAAPDYEPAAVLLEKIKMKQ